MKTSKTFWRIQAVVLVVAIVGWFQFSAELTNQIESENPTAINASSANYVAAGSSKNTKNSLYYRYWQILKQRAKKHKV